MLITTVEPPASYLNHTLRYNLSSLWQRQEGCSNVNTLQEAKTFLRKTKRIQGWPSCHHIPPIQKIKETRGNAITQPQSHPIKNSCLFYFFEGWNKMTARPSLNPFCFPKKSFCFLQCVHITATFLSLPKGRQIVRILVCD